MGRHGRVQSGGGFGAVPSSPGPSGGASFNSTGGGSKGALPSPLPYSLPPLPTSGSQSVIATY
jgi:hypothetical protein